MTRPVLYSFRRCPYAMRARLAIASAGISCELREVVLRDKAPELLQASPKATVPVLVIGDEVIEESLDIMIWALRQNDPEGWLASQDASLPLIAECDRPFKMALDRYKYGSRYAGADTTAERATAAEFLQKLDGMLSASAYLFGEVPSLGDMAILTFVRQYAFVDKDWFDAQPWPNLIRWLNAFLGSDRFAAIMDKHPKWENGDPVTIFP